MKLFEMAIAPNPRRVRMFLAEKGLLEQVERIEINLQKGENLTPEFRSKNPMTKVPVLETDDGTCIAETMAICRFVESSHPETLPLLGETPKEIALIEQWLRWIDFYLFMPTGMAFQHGSGYFKDRMKCFPEWGADCKEKVEKFFDFLNEQLRDNEYLCCGKFTCADINAYTSVQFAKVVGVRIDADKHPHLQAWHDRIDNRASAKA